MTIFLDLELEEDYKPEHYDRRAQTVQKIVKDFYASRFNVLKEEIEKEEDIQYEKKEFAYVVIPILHENIPIQYCNYSAELVSKMKSCYSPSDAGLLNRQIEDALNTFNN